MKLSEMHPEKMIAASLIERYQDRYKPMSGGLTKLVLDHGLDLNLLKSSVDQSLENYGSHPWQTADGPILRYTGFSINSNPEHQDRLNPNASSLGTPKNKSGEFFYGSFQQHQNLKNSYFDSYGFTQRTPASSEGYLGELLNSTSRTLIRSRMMILDGSYFDQPLIEAFESAKPGDSKFGWHQDEPVFVNLRVNIPITGSEAFVFEMLNEKPYFLQPGKAYSWDTHIPHRVWCKEPTTVKRYNLIIGVSPWFDFIPERQEWVPNEFCGRMHPLDMLAQGFIFPWLTQMRKASGL